jgi:hypothetical protein
MKTADRHRLLSRALMQRTDVSTNVAHILGAPLAASQNYQVSTCG